MNGVYARPAKMDGWRHGWVHYRSKPAHLGHRVNTTALNATTCTTAKASSNKTLVHNTICVCVLLPTQAFGYPCLSMLLPLSGKIGFLPARRLVPAFDAEVQEKCSLKHNELPPRMRPHKYPSETPSLIHLGVSKDKCPRWTEMGG